MKTLRHKTSVSVDSGSIMVLLTSMPKEESFPIKKGKYKITLKVRNSWNGPQVSSNYLEVKGDMFVSIADGFYRDEENGEDPVKNHEVYKKGCVLCTGGDGEFFLSIEIKKVSKIGKDPYKTLLNKAKTFLKGKKFSNELAETFVSKFMNGVYYEKVNELIMKERSKEMSRMLKEMKKLIPSKPQQ